jgi:Flp pilus assembly protein TadG
MKVRLDLRNETRHRVGRQGHERRGGAAAVELAVLLPFLMFMFLVATDWSRIFYYSMTLDNCARNGALYACNVYTNQQWQGSSSQLASVQAAAAASGTNLNPPVSASNVGVSNTTDADGNAVVIVTVTYTFQTVARYPGIPNQQIVKTAQMRIAPSTPSNVQNSGGTSS